MFSSKKLPLPTLGIDNRSDETAIPSGAVRRADNVDLRSDGQFGRRAGYTVTVAGGEYHSMHANSRGTLVVQKTQVSLLVGASTLVPFCDMGSPALVDFTEYNGATYFSNEASLWWVPHNSSTPLRVGTSAPAKLPALSVGAGSLLPGTYTVALSRVDSRGEESRTSVVGQITLETAGSIVMTDMIADLEATLRVYITQPDGDVLYLSEEFSGAFTTFVVARRPDGQTRATQHLQPMKPGTFVVGHGGRLYTATGDTLWFSEPLRPGLYDPRHNFITFAGRIRFVLPIEVGMFVGDDRGTWLLSGKDPARTEPRLVSGAPAVFRSGIVLPGGAVHEDIAPSDEATAVWLSSEGYMVGLSSGAVVPMHADRVSVDASLEGRSRFVVRDGTKQVITLLSSTQSLGHGLAVDTVQ